MTDRQALSLPEWLLCASLSGCSGPGGDDEYSMGVVGVLQGCGSRGDVSGKELGGFPE